MDSALSMPSPLRP